jgi:hypothetical protein
MAILKDFLSRRKAPWSRGNSDIIEAVDNHIEKHIGEVSFVMHEIVSDWVHVDVHVVLAGNDRKHHWLITSGMSERPMKTPKEVGDCRFAELMLCLPANWPLSEEEFKDERNYWPIRELKTLARYPHQYSTWLYGGHSIANDDPPKPFADNTAMCASLLLQPKLLQPEAHWVSVNRKKKVRLWGVFFLYREELELKLDEGSDRLEELFMKRHITELLDPNRANVANEEEPKNLDYVN